MFLVQCQLFKKKYLKCQLVNNKNLFYLNPYTAKIFKKCKRRTENSKTNLKNKYINNLCKIVKALSKNDKVQVTEGYSELNIHHIVNNYTDIKASTCTKYCCSWQN